MAKLKPGSYPITRGGMNAARKATANMRNNMRSNRGGQYGDLISKQIPSTKQIPSSPGINPMRPGGNEMTPDQFSGVGNWGSLKPGDSPRSDGSNNPTPPSPFLDLSGKPATSGQSDFGGDTMTPGFKRGGPKMKPGMSPGPGNKEKFEYTGIDTPGSIGGSNKKMKKY
tara:strand:+ start:620 stop:1126 length:507 start_codon:yes stop_codon:yes gene_type:complete